MKFRLRLKMEHIKIVYLVLSVNYIIMKKISKNHLAIITVIVAIILGGCKKEQIPVLATTDVSNLTATTATSGGSITNEGSSTVISRGVCWSTGTTPTFGDNKTTDAAGTGSFTSNLTGLSGATTYYVRAYATNSVGTGYGMALSFTTLGQAPAPATIAASNINVTTATLNGNVNANYLSTVVTFEYGITTSYGSTSTPSQSPVTGNTVTNVSSDITGLTAGTIYHYRIKAVNSLGTTYGSNLTFKTLIDVAQIEEEKIQNYLNSNPSLNFLLKSSGLYYLEITAGTGLALITHDTVYVKYTGMFLDGTVLDTNIGSPDTFKFPLNEGYVIEGFNEGVSYMREGGKATFITPSKLAYGSTGAYIIPAYTPLLWSVELVKVGRYIH